MSKDQAYGVGIFCIALAITIIYLVAFFAPWLPLTISNASQWREWAIALPLFLLVLAALVIAMWIGWTMFSTPPPLPLEAEKSEETEASIDLTSEEKTEPQTTPRKRAPRKS